MGALAFRAVSAPDSEWAHLWRPKPSPWNTAKPWVKIRCRSAQLECLCSGAPRPRENQPILIEKPPVVVWPSNLVCKYLDGLWLHPRSYIALHAPGCSLKIDARSIYRTAMLAHAPDLPALSSVASAPFHLPCGLQTWHVSSLVDCDRIPVLIPPSTSRGAY